MKYKIMSWLSLTLCSSIFAKCMGEFFLEGKLLILYPSLGQFKTR